jgi:ABC-2 type transport system ATP-binding protein
VTGTASTNDNVLQVKDLAAGYTKKAVIQDVSFHLTRGQTIGLIGLNGTGKTTLIKTILGLKEPMQGEILHEGSQEIAFLPERFDPPAFLTGYEFLKFSQKLYGHKLDKEEAIFWAQRISLDKDSLFRNVRTYSKGMRQKLGLLATMMSNCHLIILDEPMSGLDPKAQYEVKVLIAEAKENKHSIFMCTHNLNDIDVLCDHVLVVHDGQMRWQGAPAHLKKEFDGLTIEEAFLHLIDPSIKEAKAA